jgi:hypothetical protein
LVDVLSQVVSVCVMYQYRGHWLLIDALFVAITMSCKLKEKQKKPFLDNLMEENVIIVELNLLASNIIRKVCSVFDVFYFP